MQKKSEETGGEGIARILPQTVDKAAGSVFKINSMHRVCNSHI
jgi:hypothetical protein